MAVQALFRSISPNYRRITLGHNGRMWTFEFVLEREDAEDAEEIEDFVSEWEGFHDEPTPCELTVRVTADELEWPSPSYRLIYWRRERSSL